MRLALSLALSLIAGPALALSCLPADPVRDYLQAAQDKAPWIIVTGKLKFDKKRLPRTDHRNQALTPPETNIAARVRGKMLTAQGFDKKVDLNITLRAICMGPWCGAPQSGATYLLFLRQERGRYVAFADPCGNNAYKAPNKKLLNRVIDCHQGKDCSHPDPFNRP
ncbi:MAG: hypothetical protein N4A61_13690 [Pelagimonas sp.]|jgi:hypothetical protein|nr:hypothetical protein [Pelagimonas sp.]